MSTYSILNVDANEAELASKTRLLRRAGYQVFEGRNGREALRLLREASPQLLILDTVLPDINGLEICRAIKTDPSTSSIMIVQVSASPVPAVEKITGLEGGADAYLTEPFEPEELVAWVRSLLRLYQRETQNRELLAEVQTREQLLHVTFEQAGETILICDRNGFIMRASRKAEELAGQTVTGKPFGEVFPLELDSGERVQLCVEKGPCGQSFVTVPENNREVSFRRLDGKRVHALLSCGCVQNAPGATPLVFVITLTDITERKKSEREAAEGKRILDAIMEFVPEGITIADAPDVVIRRVSRYGRELSGKPREAIEGISIEEHAQHWDIYYGDGLTRARNEDLPLTRATQRGELVRDEVWVLGNPAGQRISVLCNAGPIRDAAGKITGGIIAWRDITERQQAEEQLRRFSAELEERVRERTASLEKAHATILRQLQERKHLEAQLQQAEKMESLGLLAGGIAHDFNNILNIIRSYAWILHEHRCNGEDISEISNVLDEAVEKGSSTVEQLLTLASKTELQLKPLDLDEMINDMARLVGRTFPKEIEISVKPGCDVPQPVADRNHISQALLNLCINARDAMPDGGRLTLSTGFINGRDLRERHFEAEDKCYAFLEISDTGEGMDEDIQSRIFEPFFTTKGPGKGTGLGLSMVYGIVKNHNGFIDVQSEPRQGASFRIYLPTAGGAAQKHENRG